MKFSFSMDIWMVLQLFVLPVLLPLLVGLVTKFTTSSATKSVLLLALSVVTSFATNLLTAYQSGIQQFDLGQALMVAMITFVTGVAMHYGLLKPTGASDAVQAVGDSGTGKDFGTTL